MFVIIVIGQAAIIKIFSQNDIHTEFDQKNLHVLLFIFNSHVNRY